MSDARHRRLPSASGIHRRIVDHIETVVATGIVTVVLTPAMTLAKAWMTEPITVPRQWIAIPATIAGSLVIVRLLGIRSRFEARKERASADDATRAAAKEKESETARLILTASRRLQGDQFALALLAEAHRTRPRPVSLDSFTSRHGAYAVLTADAAGTLIELGLVKRRVNPENAGFGGVIGVQITKLGEEFIGSFTGQQDRRDDAAASP